MPSLRRVALLALLIAPLPACVWGNTWYGHPIPTEDEAAFIEPGRTSRAEVLARLGPPVEDTAPTLAEEGRGDVAAFRQVFEENDLLTRRRLTYEQELRRDRYFMFIPFIPLYFYRRITHQTDRFTVFYDENEIVTATGWTLEIER